MNPENALISRRAASIDADTVVIIEEWDMHHPDCPFVSYPWPSRLNNDVMAWRTEMSQRQFDAVKPHLK